jgi:MoaA/NifB/PqqE/SkfB family radical SAM enzyme
MAALKQRALERAQPLGAHLELTYRCTWRCVFCYNPRHHDQHGLNGAEWVAVLDELRALGTLSVTLTGGDPLTHPEFFEIATAARGRGLAVRLFTNGALVTQEVAERLAGLNLVAVEMSLHGARAETHDRTTGKPGSFVAMLEAFDRLRARGVPLLLKSPVTSINEDELEGMAGLADRLEVSLNMDPSLTPRDDGDLSPLAYAPSRAGVERLFRLVAARGRLPTTGREAGGLNCGLGRITMAIDPEGNVFPCLQWRRRPLGNVREGPLRALWPSSPGRLEAAAAARTANDRLVEAGGALAAFPFCPALMRERSGDAATPDAWHRMVADIAHEVRTTEGFTPDPIAHS